MKTVKEVSELTGVSIRTLHHYDEIGLLKPSGVTEAGYRLYDDQALEKLHTILLFRELEFPLREIKAIMESPSFDPTEALEQQIQLLQKQYQHIGKLIELASEIQRRGKAAMGFEAFDQSAIEQYKQEARERWGNTAAYQQYVQKELGKTPKKSRNDGEELMAYFARLGQLRHLPPECEEVQVKISGLQALITQHYYHCTDQIFAGLGEMYAADERFRQNIDRQGGEGTAQFVRDAIRAYCKRV